MAIDINSDAINSTVNNGFELSDKVSGGIADQGTNIGNATGITIMVGIFVIAIAAVLGVTLYVLGFAKKLKAGKA
jgi:hypothetical protein